MYKNTNKVKLRYLYLKIKKKNKITKTLHILIHNIIQIYMVTMYLKGILNELSYFFRWYLSVKLSINMILSSELALQNVVLSKKGKSYNVRRKVEYLTQLSKK